MRRENRELCDIAEMDEVDVLEWHLSENVSCRNILWGKVLVEM